MDFKNNYQIIKICIKLIFFSLKILITWIYYYLNYINIGFEFLLF